jgi:hypothetical protein
MTMVTAGSVDIVMCDIWGTFVLLGYQGPVGVSAGD